MHDIESAKSKEEEESVNQVVGSINMNLDAEPKGSFDDDVNPTNIWQSVDEDESDTPAFLRRRKKKKQEDK